MRVCADAVLDNFHNSKKEAVRRLEKLAVDALPADASEQDKKDCEIELIEADLRDSAAIEKVFASHTGAEKIYAVILIGALKAVGESGEIPIDYFNVNVGGTLNLLTAMDKHDTKRLVYSSSATVYGAPETIPIPESTPMDPHSPYGHTKQICEMIIRDVCAAHPEWRAIALRYFKYVPASLTQPRWRPPLGLHRRGPARKAGQPAPAPRAHGCRQVPRAGAQGVRQRLPDAGRHVCA